ncbi:MAG: tetratricopeptide repeat protein, partial [Nitrospinae bacterium]|nr:tetratricopeptide repeat protein [Nitrospinota bacterium]
MERWSRSWVAFLIVAGLASGCYLNALGGSFISDDYRDIVNNPILQEPGRLPEIFTTSFLSKGEERGLYRPITGLTYWIGLRLFGPNPFGFHLENILWHTATALLVFVLLRELWPAEPLMAFVAAALFAVHPVHTEAVAWVSGRAEVLAAFWGLLAFWAHRRGDRERANASLWRVAAVGAWLVALGAKEMAATVPLLLLMTDALLASPSGWWRPGRLATRYGPYAGAALVYVALRLSVLGQFGPTKLSQTFYGASLSVRGATMLKVAAAYVGRLIFPVSLTFAWDVPHARGLTDGAIPLLALALLVVLLGMAWGVRQKAPPVAWGILWAGLALLPVSNLLPFGWRTAERFLYFSSVGACVALAWVMTRGLQHFKKGSPQAPGKPLAGVLGCAVLVFFAVNTIDRNRDWSDELALLQKTVDRSPANARAIDQLGIVLWRKSRYAEAEALFKRALEIREQAMGPDHPLVANSLNNLAVLYLQKGKYTKAE